MPFLDVTDVLLDIDFAEYLNVFRRRVAIGDNGRQTITTTQILPRPIGVAVPSFTEVMGNQTVRDPDIKYTPRAIRVFTPFVLLSVAPGYDGDILVWSGDQYVVNKVVSFMHFGQGWIAAECASIDSIDLPAQRT